MNALILHMLFFAAVVPTTLDQVKAEPNLERRARAAVDFAFAAERDSESAYSSGDLDATKAAINAMVQAVELAHEAFQQSGLSPGRNPRPYKYAELHLRELLVRLTNLDRKMDADERTMLDQPRTRIQEIHDEWFEGIMGRRK
jgi:hypothetical protein